VPFAQQCFQPSVKELISHCNRSALCDHAEQDTVLLTYRELEAKLNSALKLDPGVVNHMKFVSVAEWLQEHPGAVPVEVPHSLVSQPLALLDHLLETWVGGEQEHVSPCICCGS
jgi:hypothetical protein